MKIEKETKVVVKADDDKEIRINELIIVKTKDGKVLVGFYKGINQRGAMEFNYDGVTMRIMPSSIEGLKKTGGFKFPVED